MTNNSIFTRVLSLVLCVIMFAGVLTSCFQMPEFKPTLGTHNHTTPNAGTTTGDRVDDEPTDDPTTPETPVDPNELYSGSTTLANSDLIYGTLANDVFIGGEDGVAAMIPADVKVEAGASSLALSIKKVEEETLADTLSNLDVHISGVALDNTVPMTVMLGAILPAGLGLTELKLYHVENGTPVAMMRVNSVNDFAIHNQYVYDAETGNVTIYVSSFSVFTAVQSTADVWDGKATDTSWYNENDTEFTITTVEQFIGFRDLVDAGNTFEGKTVILGTDIDLADKPFDPIGFGYYKDEKRTEEGDTNTVFLGTFDGGNHTIYNLYENCWELDPDKTNYGTYTYSTAGAGLFASIKNATIKNIAINGAEVVFECVDMGVLVGYAQGECHFENIIITNANIANYNRYTGGLVGEVSYGPYGTDTTKGYSHTFKNITIDSTVTVSGLWGSFGCGMGGVIGGKWGNATVLMENVVSAPVMDVYNDVVSAYQWYAFRGCGMLIGHTEEPYSDGRTSGIATASFLTCENVKVYYGDWVNYTYYEFGNQDSGTGKNYPWVRAEAGEYCDAFSNIRYGVPTHNGVKVSDLTKEELKAVATDYTPIIFNQLYGADRGMYGQEAHEGVTVIKTNTKTIYIQNNLGWANLKLHYWYKHGDDTWTNHDADGIVLTEENGVYKVSLPAYAFAFKITADGENVTRDFYLSEVTEPETYNLDFEHVHYFAGNKCDCGAVKQLLEHEFTLGEDGEAKHSDGGNAVTTYEENGFTLTLEGLSSVYGNARDAMGNSCIKLGTGSLTGSFSFTVPAEVEKVIIYVAGYKGNDITIEINNVQYEITTHSNDGEYTAIEVDTSETKTVSLTTVEVKGEPRCMINTIVFVTSRVVEVHDCDENTELPAVAPSCTENGFTAGKACSICGKVMLEQTTVPATGHTEEAIPAVDATCTKNGLTEGTRCSVCKKILVEQKTIVSTGHNYVEGTCSKCGEAFPTTSGTYTYVFSNYTAGTQYAKGEIHELDTNVTITTYDCHFTDELRIYSSATNNGYVIIHSLNPITEIGVNAGNKVDTINIYVSNDGVNWSETPIEIEVTSTSYKDYEVSLNGEYKYLKLDVAGSNQIRIKSMTLTTVPDCAHASTTEKVVAPTCTETGYTNTVCSSCGKVMSTVEGNPATGHSYNSEVTTVATCTAKGETTYTCTACDDTYTEEIPTIAHTDVNTDKDHKCDTCGAENVTEHVDSDGDTVCDNGCGVEISGATHECEHKCAKCGKCTDKECTEDACADKCEGHEPTWTLVTDASKLQASDKIIIVAKDYTYALSTTQNTNNRGQIAITKDGNTLTIVDGVQIITLEVGTADGTFAFYTGSGYLYAASSSSNYLKTQTTNNANGSWKITIAADGTATIVAQGTNSRNTMQYNQSSSLFACYSSESQKAIVIYKLEGGETPTPDTPACTHENKTTNTVPATCTTAGSTTVTCDDCGETVSKTNVDALGHTTQNGTCENCGETIGSTNVTYYIFKATVSGKIYYWDGTVSSGKGALTTDASKAAKFIVEETTGGYYIYTEINGTKNYIKIGTSNTSLSLTTTATVVQCTNTGYVYSGDRYLATYGTQDLRTYKATNITGTNVYMILTES